MAEAVPAPRRLKPLRGLLPFIAPYRRQIALALLFLLLAASATLAMPYAVRLLVDQGLALPAGSELGDKLVAIRSHFGLLFGVAVGLGVFTAARFFMVTWIGERVTADLRQAVYAHVLTQSPQFFETLKTGEVLSRLTTDTTVIQSAVGSSVSMGLRNAVLFVGGIAMLIATSPRLMLTVVGIIVLVVAPAMLIGGRVRRLSRASQDRIADSSAIAGEVLNAVPVVQSFTQEGAETRKFSDANERAFATSIRRTGTRAMLTAFLIVGIFGSLLYGLYGGVQAVMAGRITAGELSQTALYIMVVAGSVAVLAEVWGELLRASGATERLMELLSTQSPIATPARPVALPRIARRDAGEFRERRLFLSVAAAACGAGRLLAGRRTRADAWRWSAPRARARAPCSSSCSGSTTSAADRSPSTASMCASSHWTTCAAISRSSRRRRRSSPARCSTTFDTGAPRQARRKPRRQHAPRAWRSSCCGYPTATARKSANAACDCRAASASGWRLRGRSSRTRRCCCSTKRRRHWTPRASAPCSPRSRPRCADARRSSSRTGWRPCSGPAASSCSTMAASWTAGTHAELIARGGLYGRLAALQFSA